MEYLAEIVGGLASIGVGGLIWKVHDLNKEVASLRKSRHDHGNKFSAYDVEIGNIKRRLEKMGNGDR